MKRNASSILCVVLASVYILRGELTATEPPGFLNHLGRIVANGVNFDGEGHFKLALVNGTGDRTCLSNDLTGTAGHEHSMIAYEGERLRLWATVTMDDDTLLAPPSLRWAVIEGPTDSIDRSGFAYIGSTRKSTSATMEGRYLEAGETDPATKGIFDGGFPRIGCRAVESESSREEKEIVIVRELKRRLI